MEVVEFRSLASPHLEGLVDDEQLNGEGVGLLLRWLRLLRFLLLDGGGTASGLYFLYIVQSGAAVEEFFFFFYLLLLRGLLCVLCLLIG